MNFNVFIFKVSQRDDLYVYLLILGSAIKLGVLWLQNGLDAYAVSIGRDPCFLRCHLSWIQPHVPLQIIQHPPYLTLHLTSQSVAGIVCLCKLALRVGRMEPNKTTEKSKGFFQPTALYKNLLFLRTLKRRSSWWCARWIVQHFCM
jgi:hypothetical protein